MFFEDEEFADKKSEIISNMDNGEWLICDGVLEEYRNKKIEEVVVPNGVTSINTYAIMTDNSIKSIVLPKSVKRLESTGIAECSNLTKVVIENPDIEIMEWGLSFNESLKEVYIGGKRIDSIVAKRYSDGAKCFERYLGEGEEIVVEQGVKQINNNAFENCKTLRGIILPDTIDTICDNAFSNSTNVRELKIPQSVDKLGDSAFYGWTENQTLYIPEKFEPKARGLFKKFIKPKAKWQSDCNAKVIYY